MDLQQGAELKSNGVGKPTKEGESPVDKGEALGRDPE
jgi:hypothetical protein